MNNGYLIVVGVDGSEGGRRALEWAIQEADARGGAVEAVTAWSWDGLDFGPVTATTAEEEQERAARLLADEIKAMRDRHGSHLPVAAEVVEGRPSDVLTTAGRAGDLLVLGSHGHSAVHHIALGSVAEDCIRKASCPVVVIPVPAARPPVSTEPVPR